MSETIEQYAQELLALRDSTAADATSSAEVDALRESNAVLNEEVAQLNTELDTVEENFRASTAANKTVAIQRVRLY